MLWRLLRYSAAFGAGLATARWRAGRKAEDLGTILTKAQSIAGFGTWDWDAIADRVEWSDELYRIYGMPIGSVQHKEDYLCRVHPDDRAAAVAQISNASDPTQPFAREERIVRPDGEERIVQVYGLVDRERASVRRIIGCSVDVTERRRAEQRMRELSRELVEAQERERRRIALALHDDLGQILAAVHLNLSRTAREPEEAERILCDTRQLVCEAATAVRNLTFELRPPLLDDQGLVAALRWWLQEQAARAGFDPRLRAPESLAPLPHDVETTCFRIAQEAIANAAKHAHARTVEVTMERGDRGVEVAVWDDGVGFAIAETEAKWRRGPTLGILGMRERAQLCGGELSIESQPGAGTTVRLRVPA
jgi:PAS domain S-box-containing protein